MYVHKQIQIIKYTKLMKNFKSTVMTFAKGLLSVALVASMVTSCYDDSALWAKIEDINTKLNDLETSLNNQIQTLNDLLAGGDITISECTKNADGTYNITLSNGTKFSVFPQDKTLKGIVSTININGVDYWGIYNDEGQLVPIKDAENKNITVASVIPTVEERDGVYYLVVGDQEYITGYEKEVAVITNYEINKDDSGNIYSVTFTFGSEALTFTIPMANYKGFSFVLGDGVTNSKVIKDLYVSNGATYQISAKLDGVVDYVPQIPAGWKMDESVDNVTGATSLYITAPTEEAVASGSAVAEGYLKVVAVLEDGKAMIAKLYLTTSPFKTFTATTTHAIIEKYNGVDKFLYGLSAFADYSEAQIFASAAEMLAQNAEGVSERDINALLTDLLGSEIVPDTPYILWAIPAFYSQDEDNVGYYVKEGLIKTLTFGGTALKLNLGKVGFNDAAISFAVDGIEAYYGGVALKSETVFDDILYSVNNEILEPVTSPMVYEGSAFAFPSAKANETISIKSETTYISWVIPVSEVDSYTIDNIAYQEFTLLGVTAGGSTEVDLKSATVDRVSISVPVESEGAQRLYYTFILTSNAGRINGQEAKYLLSKGTIIDAGSAEVAVDQLEPGTSYTLFVMSVDEDGKYGAVAKQAYTTLPLEYNSLTIDLTVTEASQNTAKATVASAGAVDFVYWVGRSTDPLWVNGGDTNAKKVASIQKRLALYPNDSEFQRIRYNHPLENGVLTMTDLKGETEHHVVILAQDATGKYSQAQHATFNTLAVNLGTIVREGSNEWILAKGQVDIKWNENSFLLPENSNMSAYYSFEIKCPTNLTAYILCMTEEYFVENPEINTVEDKIIDIEAYCSRKYDSGKVALDANGQLAEEPDWVDDDNVTHDGTLLNVYDFYVHGFPTNGFVTYFAADSHKQGNCTSWENGACYNYNYAYESITKRHTVDYFIDYVKRNRTTCRTEATINKVAQDLFEAYYPYYKDAQPLIYINNGDYLHMANHYAAGLDEDGNVVDDVFVVFKDAQGNYYEPMKFEVPNYYVK